MRIFNKYEFLVYINSEIEHQMIDSTNTLLKRDEYRNGLKESLEIGLKAIENIEKTEISLEQFRHCLKMLI